MRLIFIRHGDPDYSIDSLTDKGWREAELLSKRVSNWEVDEIYCSILGRAKDTAKASLEKLNKEATICEWLKEFIVPIKDTTTGEERIPWDFMPSDWTNDSMLYHKDEWYHTDRMKSGNVKEAYLEVCKRFDELLSSHGYHRNNGYYVTEESNSKTIVFYCHLGTICVIISHLLGIAPTQLWQGFFIAPTSVTVFNSEERMEGDVYFRCQVLGDTKHLSDGNEPISGSGYFAEVFQG